VLPIIRSLQLGGISNNAIASQLNERNVKTARGGDPFPQLQMLTVNANARARIECDALQIPGKEQALSDSQI
jgi:hypothetical protein